MPITEIQLQYRDMKRISETHVCGKCGGNLVLTWGGAYNYNCWILRCTNDITHDTLNRHDEKYEAELKKFKEAHKMDSQALTTMTESQMGKRIDMARFPQQLTIPEKKLLIQVAISYGLDPLMREITVYQGSPFVSIDGRYRKAQETELLDGVESRPATTEERLTWKVKDEDYFFRSEVWKKGCSHSFVGWGLVKYEEIIAKSKRDPTKLANPVIASNPQRMAEKRAEAQALRKGFHLPLPSTEDIGSEETPSRDTIDSSSEFIDSTDYTIIEPSSDINIDDKSKCRDLNLIKTFTDLMKACHDDFGLQPKDVLKELNVRSQSEISESPWDCYNRIASARV